MKKNVGNFDRAIRLVLGIVLGFSGLAYGSLLATLVGVILVLTAVFSFCPLYSLLGISTNNKDSGAKKHFAR